MPRSGHPPRAALRSPPRLHSLAQRSPLSVSALPPEIILHKQSLGLDGCHLFNSLDKAVDAQHPRQGGEEREGSASLSRRKKKKVMDESIKFVKAYNKDKDS